MPTLLRRGAALFVALTLVSPVFPAVAGAESGEDTLTLTFYPRAAREKFWGVVVPWGQPETVTVKNYRIADVRGNNRNHILLETSSGTTRLLFDEIRRIDFVSYSRVYFYNSRVESLRFVVRANIFLTDGSRIENGVVNAFWGQVDGDTELGEFFLNDPMTVSSITWNGH